MRQLIRVCLSAIAIATLILLGWGIRDLGTFFTSFARAAFLPVMLIAMASATLSIPNATRKGTRTPPGQRCVLALVQIVTIPLLFFLPYADKHGILVMHAQWVRWLGFGMAISGYVVTVIALRTLGRNYSVYVTIQEQHCLVQTGIYGRVRNPIYLGILLSWPGVCLVFRSWLVLPLFGFFLIFGVLRGAQEERVLREEFGADFASYRARTWHLVPYLY